MTELDATGLRCPLPVLKARKALKSVGEGEILTVLATDPAAVKDFQAFCAETAHTFVDSSEQGGVYRITLQRG